MRPELQLRPIHAPAMALFVDAGWLLASAGIEVVGSKRREDVACKHAELLPALTAHMDGHSPGLRRLRTYWYDGAPDGRPTWEHNHIARLPYTTVRLGELSGGQQKGVDVLIYRDLMKLARERAIVRAYLLAGDEDLREGVVEAKELGVQVILLGLPTEKSGHDLSARLVLDCDEYLVLPGSTWRPHFIRRDEAATPEDDEVVLARELGERFARDWAARSSGEEARQVLAGFPTVPQSVDVELLVFAEGQMGSLRQRPDLKTEIRGTFRSALRRITEATSDGQEGPQSRE